MTKRKLASIRKISALEPIEGADLIEVATVDGWKVVVKRGEFTVGELVVYFEIDSWIPYDLAPFLSKGQEPRVYHDVKGERLRTIKLRGQVSQGLILKETDILEQARSLDSTEEWVEGTDLTSALNIQKWEAPIPAQLAGQAAGMFPTSLIPKTDQERIQNYMKTVDLACMRNQMEKYWDEVACEVKVRPVVAPKDFVEPTFELTMKLDGSSMTIFRWEGELRVCSRNLELKINEENKDNAFVAMAMKIGDSIPNGLAVQGELMGPGIQGNRENFKELKFFVFDMFNIKEYKYLTSKERHQVCASLNLDHVPVLDKAAKAFASVEEALAIADGPSINHKIREGVVWKCNEDPSFSFKAISNNFLLKEK